MAYMDRILQLDETPLVSESIGTTSQGTAVTVGSRKVVVVSIGGAAHIDFGPTTTITTSTADFYLPTAGLYTFQMPPGNPCLKLYNPSGSAAIWTSVNLVANC